MKFSKLEHSINTLLLILIYFTWVVLIYSYFFDLNIKGKGALAGDISIILLWVSCLPGILKRFRVRGFLSKVEVFLMFLRKRLGILMFMFALLHFAWYGLYRNLQKGMFPDFFEMKLHAQMGFVAIALTLPLFLTSSAYARRILGSFWQKIHNLVYIVMWFSALHVFFNDNLNYAIPTAVVGVAQIASHIFNRYKK